MKKIAYLECPTGIAGDMCLGALVSAGVPLDYLIEKLNGLGISEEYQLRAELVHRNGQQATKVYVDLKQTVLHSVSADSAAVAPLASDEPAEPPTFSNHHHSHGENHNPDRRHDADANHRHTRHLPEIERMIASARLPARAQAWSLAVFRKLAQAEGAVHGIPPQRVHFHEVGATDAIVDIVGTCLGLDWLGIDELYCSALPTGGGTVRAAHGELPVPTPAVLKLWEMRQVPVYSNGVERELVTPTGAAIAVTLAKGFGSVPAMAINRLGSGAGTRQLAIPNILRLWIGKKVKGKKLKVKIKGKKGKAEQVFSSSLVIENSMAMRPLSLANGHKQKTNESQIVSVLETQIDDLSPQAIGYVFDALFDAGALDVFTQSIGMKKCRPGILLTVICLPENQAACEATIFRETTTLGIRRQTQERAILQREIEPVQTPLGQVRVKVAKSGDTITNVQPEYEDCAQLAKQHNLSWREVHRIVLQTWYSQSQQ